MANIRNYSHDIVHKPGDEGTIPDQDKQAEELGNEVPTITSHDVVHKPGSEGTSKMSVNDDGYRQGYICSPIDQKVPNYVGPGGPRVDATRVPPANNSNPTPEMPGAN